MIHERIMDCSAFCTASSFDIKSFYQTIKSRYKTSLFRDVLHIETFKEDGEDIIDVLYFPYGAVICWGANIKEARRFLEEVEEFQREPLKVIETDDFSYSYGEELKMIEDDIILPDEELLTKVAVSHGLAQSVKLGAFEFTISEAFEKTKHIPEDLAKKGKIRLSRKEIRKKMGELFIDRSSINLHVDVLDTPEFFWEYPELEPHYSYIANELDIETRGQVLNQRLDVLRELFEMLGNEVDNQHSTRLEWIIILLIMSEVILSILTHYDLI
jgi:uncharacterized Rmd1/YagE family protein